MRIAFICVAALIAGVPACTSADEPHFLLYSARHGKNQYDVELIGPNRADPWSPFIVRLLVNNREIYSFKASKETAFAICWFLGRALADSDSESRAPVRLILHPAVAPTPALARRLLPELTDQKPGNAVTLYEQASLIYRERRLTYAEQEKLYSWLEGPCTDLPRQQVRELLSRFEETLRTVEQASVCGSCDWDPLTRASAGLFDYPGPALNHFGLLLVLRSRLALAEGRLEDALRTVRVGLAMARHCGESPYMAWAMLGMRITSQMVRTLEQVIQKPAAPNLYWALTALPRPFINLAPAIEGEQLYLKTYMSQLNGIEDRPFNMVELWAVLGALVNQTDVGGPQPPWQDFQARLGMIVDACRHRKQNERALAADGWCARRLRRMSAVQLYVIDAIHQYKRLWDGSAKWFYLPYWQAVEGLKKAHQDLIAERWRSWPGKGRFPLAPLIIRDVFKVKFDQAKLERRLELLRTMEAIRLYAQAHAGKPPAMLRDSRDSPIPLDPMTNQPFGYRVTGHALLLTAPYVNSPSLYHEGDVVAYELIIQR
jgi:hypothetical protein